MKHTSPQIQNCLLKENTIVIADEYSFCDIFTFKVIGCHTIGSSVIYFHHATRHYVITGDKCYVFDNLFDQRPIGIFYSKENN